VVDPAVLSCIDPNKLPEVIIKHNLEASIISSALLAAVFMEIILAF
jgi:hypothetical protein